MPVFVVDEDIARSIGRALVARGFVVKDIRDFGLRGAPDETIYRFAQDNRAALVTADVDFGNPLRFPPTSHFASLLPAFQTKSRCGKWRAS